MMATCIMLPIPHAADPTTPAPVSWLMFGLLRRHPGRLRQRFSTIHPGPPPRVLGFAMPQGTAAFFNYHRVQGGYELLISLCLRTQLRLCLAVMSCAILIRVALVR
jgi:hypothetical protein